MQTRLGKQTIVLLGIGHTNAHVLRMWKMKPLDDTQLICVSNFPKSTYSGMMPAVLAGQYNENDMEIDLVRFCASAGVRLVIGDVAGLDQTRQRLLFRDRPPIQWDLLSIGVGSRPSFRNVDVRDHSRVVSIKPMQRFMDRLRQHIGEASLAGQGPKVAIIGGGLGGIEIACALDQRLKTDPQSLGAHPNAGHEIQLVTAAEQIEAGLSSQAAQRIDAVLRARQIDVRFQTRVTAIDGRTLEVDSGAPLEADVVIWATSAVGPPVLDKLNLDQDERGFLRTRATLQSVSHDRVFAVGDSGSMIDHPLPKAGVFAVRQGPVLWDNLRRSIWDRSLLAYQPQTGFLKLVNSSDGKAVMDYRGRGFYGRWCWWLKDRIDSKFMAMFHDYQPMKMTAPPSTTPADMRCLGCGGKIGGQLLSEVLSELEVEPHDDVVIGLDQPDDAAIVKTSDQQVTVTTDFFASPINDPYLVGRIALLNAASDLFVMGAQPTAALAMVQIPEGHHRGQSQVMRELMAGCLEELKRMRAALVGGHSIEGPRLMAGFTVLGKQLVDPTTKGRLRVGDRLILSKPLGTGVLLAGLMQAKLDADGYQQLVHAMTQSNAVALELIRRFDVSALTDVTGFGLAGHLIEMLKASRISARLQLDSVPLLPGTRGLMSQGIESTLTPDNRQVSEQFTIRMGRHSELESAPLFDPQTAGGLLIGAGKSVAPQVLALLADYGFDHAAIVGEVVEGPERLELVLE